MKRKEQSEVVHALDISGSNIKYAVLEITNDLDTIFFIEKPVSLGIPSDWDRFEEWISYKLEEAKFLGISCAGFIDSDAGEVVLFRRAGWKKRPLVKNFKANMPNTKVVLLNDGEAHLISALLISGIKHPVLSLSIGTALGFSMTDEQGNLYRPRKNSNFDIGSIMIPTRASRKEVWWALGSEGLAELQKNMNGDDGVKHFGYRLGAYLANLTILLQPRTIILSGGIVENHWDKMSPAIIEEFNKNTSDFLRDLRGYIDAPTILKSPHGDSAALVGIAYYSVFWDTHVNFE